VGLASVPVPGKPMSLPVSEWVKLYFTDRLTPDEWQLRMLDDLEREGPRVFNTGRRFVGVDWGAGDSFTAWRTIQTGEVYARRAGKTAEAERRAGVVRLVELEPGVWGVPRS